MKKLLASLGVIAMALAIATPALAAATTSVSATVTAEIIAVSVTDGSVAYGTIGLNSTEDTTLATGTDDTQTVTNDSNVNADLAIRSSDAASAGTAWNLAATAGTDEFTHEFSTDSGTTWPDFNADNNTYSTIASTVSPAGTQDFDLRIGTPVSSTDALQHTVTVTVQASAI